jgi:hypothetical protein
MTTLTRAMQTRASVHGLIGMSPHGSERRLNADLLPLVQATVREAEWGEGEGAGGVPTPVVERLPNADLLALVQAAALSLGGMSSPASAGR